MNHRLKTNKGPLQGQDEVVTISVVTFLAVKDSTITKEMQEGDKHQWINRLMDRQIREPALTFIVINRRTNQWTNPVIEIQRRI